ncbi:MurR/RpiR family transcriptional regulator [uncultured Catenibacterium sp.]|uniref:MurR/RpiR family transcriptional regulator n=2 Tax=Catenibacterium TaxID=135858 RepID=UPI0025974BB3|nr:MurR/RpiR family transcriptional regulator [uncultured Catenibacterium sp.]
MRFAYSQVENLNEAEMCVYNYIVKNLKHILNLSVRELADEVHVSTATVMRFCKKMGYSGFSELKYKIKEFYEQQDQADNYEINDIDGFVEHIKSNDYLDRLKKAADLIKGADKFQILGLGVCRDIAKYTAQRFCRAGFYCYGIDDVNYPILEVPEGAHSVILIIYNHFYQKVIFDQINKYKSKNYTIIMISLANIGKFNQLCDLTIYASNGIMKVGQVESGVPMLYTLEKLMDEVIK